MMARNASSPEQTNRAGSAADHLRKKKYHIAISIMHGLTLQLIPPPLHMLLPAAPERTIHLARLLIEKVSGPLSKLCAPPPMK